MIMDPIGTTLGILAIGGVAWVGYLFYIEHDDEPKKAEPEPCSDYEHTNEQGLAGEGSPKPPHKPRPHHKKRPF